MTGRWWIGITAGMAIGLGGVVAMEAATDEAAAARQGPATIAQLDQVKRIATAAVKRNNLARTRLNKIGLQLPMWAVSSGGAGSNLIRGDGALLSQRIDAGNYRVRFVRPVKACTWSATAASENGALPQGFSIRLALDLTEVSGTQLIVRTNDGNGPADSPFHIQVFC